MSDENSEIEIVVTHGIQPHTKAGAIGGVDSEFGPDGRPLIVLSLGPDDGPSVRVDLHEGDTFELGPELWQVTKIKDPNTIFWAGFLTRRR